MKSFIPGTMSNRYIEELGKLERKFLQSITESPEDTARYDAAYKAWVASTMPKREG